MANELIRIEDLRKDYHVGDFTVHALRHVTLTIDRGTFAHWALRTSPWPFSSYRASKRMLSFFRLAVWTATTKVFGVGKRLSMTPADERYASIGFGCPSHPHPSRALRNGLDALHNLVTKPSVRSVAMRTVVPR